MLPTAAVTAAVIVAFVPVVELPSKFWGITPEVLEAELPDLKRKSDKAVLLVHGLLPRPLHPERAEKPDVHNWQEPSSALVKGLAPEFDVFGFSYAQTGGVDSVAMCRGLTDGVAALKKAGYKEIVLIGHSCGAIISRRFVELHPDAGVTKVVSVAGPYLGSVWARLPTFTLPKPQVPFIQSLLPETREEWEKGWERTVSKDLEFCCVLCKTPRLAGDTVVPLRSQWPEELQRQGIPAVLVPCTHFDAMTCDKGVKAVLEVTRGKVLRWKPEEVAKARAALFGDREKK
jgi:hypothetical protein